MLNHAWNLRYNILQYAHCLVKNHSTLVQIFTDYSSRRLGCANDWVLWSWSQWVGNFFELLVRQCMLRVKASCDFHTCDQHVCNSHRTIWGWHYCPNYKHATWRLACSTLCSLSIAFLMYTLIMMYVTSKIESFASTSSTWLIGQHVHAKHKVDAVRQLSCPLNKAHACVQATLVLIEWVHDDIERATWLWFENLTTIQCMHVIWLQITTELIKHSTGFSTKFDHL